MEPDAPGAPRPRTFVPLAPLCDECGFHHANGDHVYARRLRPGESYNDLKKRAPGARLRERIESEARHATGRARAAMLRRKGV